MLQAYCLTDVDEINPLGIEIWYRRTRRYSILRGIEAIRSVPKKYRTRYLALVVLLLLNKPEKQNKPLNRSAHCAILATIWLSETNFENPKRLL